MWQAPPMVPEAELEQTENGLVAKSDGWFVLNARDAPWRPGPDRCAYCLFEGETDFEQVGVHLVAMRPGEPMAMYHWESDQEDFLVLSGEATLVIEGEERPLRQWDFVHCPTEAKHVIVGAERGPASSSPSGRASDARRELGRLHRGREGRATRRERRGGHHRAREGIRAVQAAHGRPVPGGLAARLSSARGWASR